MSFSGCLTYRCSTWPVHLQHSSHLHQTDPQTMINSLCVLLMALRASLCIWLVNICRKLLSFQAWEKLLKWALNPTLQKAKVRLSSPGLALKNWEKVHKNKNFTTRGNKKSRKTNAVENIRRNGPSRRKNLWCRRQVLWNYPAKNKEKRMKWVKKAYINYGIP